MAASPSQQTHWLNLRVDLGLQRNSDMDPSVGSGLGRVFFFFFFFFLLSVLCSAMQCRGQSMYAHSSQEGRGGAMRFFPL